MRACRDRFRSQGLVGPGSWVEIVRTYYVLIFAEHHMVRIVFSQGLVGPGSWGLGHMEFVR